MFLVLKFLIIFKNNYTKVLFFHPIDRLKTNCAMFSGFEINLRQIAQCFQVSKITFDNVGSGFNYIMTRIQVRADKEVLLRKRLKLTLAKYVVLWHASYRNKYIFDSRNQGWLDSIFETNDLVESPRNQECLINESAKRGRPTKEFNESSSRTKRRLIASMSFDSKTESVEKILSVAQRTAFNKRDFNLVKLFSVVTMMRHESLLLYTHLTTLQEKMISEEAFSYFLNNKLSKSVYENNHKEAPCRFPSYRAIVEIKNECSPLRTSIKVTETKAKVHLQDLIDHTSKRLVKLPEKEILKYLNDRKTHLCPYRA